MRDPRMHSTSAFLATHADQDAPGADPLRGREPRHAADQPAGHGARQGRRDDGLGRTVTGEGVTLLSMDLIHTDVPLGTQVGRTSGESIQMRFKDDGWVMVQPCEEGTSSAARQDNAPKAATAHRSAAPRLKASSAERRSNRW